MSPIMNEAGVEYKVDENNMLVDGVLIKVELSEIIALDLEGFLDLISERAGFPLLMEQSYEVEGHEDNTLVLRVRGDVSMHVGDQP